MEEMPEWDPKKIKTVSYLHYAIVHFPSLANPRFEYPMVWMTPDGRKALQVHGIAVRKMFLRRTPDSKVEEVDDVVRIRKLLHSWQERIIRPEHVLSAPVEEGDVQLWDNWVSHF